MLEENRPLVQQAGFVLAQEECRIHAQEEAQLPLHEDIHIQLDLHILFYAFR